MKDSLRRFAKALVATTLVVAIVSGGVSIAPKRAEALTPVSELGPALLKDVAIAFSTGATAVASNALVTKGYVLDPLAYTVSKIALAAITKSVVNWINSGFNGSPAFVTDINQSLLRVGDTYATSFLGQLSSNSSIRSPFQSQVAQSVRANYFLSTGNDGFFQNNPYTLNKVVKNDSAFLRGDFTQGGWSGFLSAAQPSNNPFGAQLLGQDQLQSVVGNAVQNQKTEWQWGNGMNSFRGRNCGSVGGAPRVSVTNLGASVRNVALTTVNNCLFNAIQTPGGIIANAANQYLVNSGVNQYVNANALGQVVNALMGQLVNKVLGPGGVFGLSQPSSGGGSSPIDQAANPANFSQTSSPAGVGSQSTQFLTVLGNQLQVLQGYQANWQKINTSALAAQQALAGCGMPTSAADTVVTQSAAALSNASISLTALGKIQGEFTAAAASASDPTVALNTAQADYATFLAAATTPRASDIQYASDQSSDTVDQTPASLYTQMTQLQATAVCAAPH